MMNRRGVTKRTGGGVSSTGAPGGRSVAPGGRSSAATPVVGCRRPPGSGTLVLAERNQAVAAVGAWVEDGHELQQHPFVLALLTEEQQSEVRRQREQRLLHFQRDVRRRVQQAQDLRERRRRHELLQNTPLQQVSQQRHSPAKHQFQQQGVLISHDEERRAAEQHSSQQPSRAMRHVRRRLAKCQILTGGEMMSEFPGGVWHVSPTRDKPISKTPRAEVETNEEEEEPDSEAEDEDIPSPGGHACPLDVPSPGGHACPLDVPSPGGHACPLVRQSVYVHAGGRKSVTFDTDPVNDHHRTGPLRSTTRVPEVLWPLDDPQDIKRQQHQSRLVRQRRLYMDMEREQVKEHRRQSKHLKRIARIKAEHERLRQEEERSLDDRERQRAARRRMEERELLILQRLRLEEEQRGARAGTEKSRKPRDKDGTRFVEAFRARLKERLPQAKLLDLPPLCCCGEAFWDSHPDTCANNCVFYNNPKAYVRALQSAVFSLDLLEGSAGAPHWMPTH